MNKNGSKGKGGGNTNSPLEERESACKKWCFTLNNYKTSEYEAILQIAKSGSNKYIIGKEIGEKKTPHLQGYINFETKTRLSALKKLNNRVHWERCKGSEEDNIKYCSKEGKYETNLKVKKPIKILDKELLFPWQEELIEIIKKEPDDRKIYWYWDKEGGTGKTTFMKYLMFHHNAIPVEGKKNDILYCAAEHESDLYIFDFERSMEEFISYAAMEKIKNGAYMCAKYESKPVLRNCPHIICFANFEPDKEKLSKDRWIIREIKKKKIFKIINLQFE